VDEPRVTQVMHQPLGGSVTNPDSSFNNRESNDILTDKQKTAYSQMQGKHEVLPDGFNNPLSPPS